MVKCEYLKDVYIVKISGDIDHYTSEIIKKEIYKNTNRYIKDMIMDLSDVDFMDSSGIGMVLGRYKEVKDKDGRLALVGVKGNMERIFNMSGLYKIVSKFDSIGQAFIEWGIYNE